MIEITVDTTEELCTITRVLTATTNFEFTVRRRIDTEEGIAGTSRTLNKVSIRSAVSETSREA